MNLKHYTCDDISEAINGNIIIWNSSKYISNFTNSLNKVTRNSIYFLYNTLRDEKTIISSLVEAKSSGIVVKKASFKLDLKRWHRAGLGIIEVESLDSAFMKMAGLYTSNADIPIVQVIGSSGKTTTKEMLGAILQYSMPAVMGANNDNTPIDIAEHVSSLRDFHRAAVFEAGMDGRGIMRLSTNIINPTIGIVTGIHRAHFCRLGGSINEIIAAKAELLEHLAEDGYLIINGEDENCRKFPLENYKGHIRTFGFSGKYDIWASNIRTVNFKTYFIAHIKKTEINCKINTLGKYNVGNALAAILAALIIGVSPESIVKGLASFNPYPSRLHIFKGINNTTLINDNFNANPDSTRMLLEEVPNFKKDRPVILVMGDMENPKDEISEYARKVHFEIGQLIGKLEIKHLFAIGKWAAEYMNGALSSGMRRDKIYYFKAQKEAADKLIKSIIPNAIILFKGSIAYVDLTTLVDMLKESEEPELAIDTSSKKIRLSNQSNKKLVIDIDGVLSVEDDNTPLSKRALISETQTSLKILKEKGYTIILHTSRFKSQGPETVKWLKDNNIPFDAIVFEKPRGILYIDDRGYRFSSWKQFFDEVVI